MVDHKIFQNLDRILLALSAAILAAIAGLTIVQVFFRYILNDALSWSAELTKIGFIWMTFIGSAVAINRRRHLRIDSFIGLLSEKARIILDFLVHVIVAAVMVFLTVRGYSLAIKALNTMTGALMWPRTVFFLPLVLGAFFMFIFSIRILELDLLKLHELRGKGNNEGETEE